MINKLDYQQLDKELDRVKVKVFLSKNAAFLGSLMSSLEFSWDENIDTAATNGISIKFNPSYFNALVPTARISVLTHELWHVAYMHMIRRNERDPKIWNYACDTVLDNNMDYEGYDMVNLYPVECGFPVGSKCFINHDYDNLSAEQIYDIYMQDPEMGQSSMFCDLEEPSKAEGGSHAVINAVVQAKTAATLGGAPSGTIPGEIETLLNKFLNPKLPWEQLLMNFFNDLVTSDYSWARPNRRYLADDLYLPSLVPTEGLENINYYLDVSGSVTDEQVIRFNSEVKYIKETFNPIKLTIALFDTKITNEIVLNQEDEFSQILVVGRGGTDLRPVREHIINSNPNAAIIFSDLWVTPMEILPIPIPIIWVAIDNQSAQVNMGKLIHIKE